MTSVEFLNAVASWCGDRTPIRSCRLRFDGGQECEFWFDSEEGFLQVIDDTPEDVLCTTRGEGPCHDPNCPCRQD